MPCSSPGPLGVWALVDGHPVPGPPASQPPPPLPLPLLLPLLAPLLLTLPPQPTLVQVPVAALALVEVLA